MVDSLRGYNRASFLADLAAGVTVGVIALPLAIGFGIASGVSPTQGIWTAIIAGFLISALGGSKVQIGGPTGAFIPILAVIVLKYGYDGLALATIMAGVILVVMGALKLGNLIKFIPYPVIAGFTSGIAVIIFVGQLKEFFGLNLQMPEHTPHQIAVIAQHLRETSWHTVLIGCITLAVLIVLPKIRGVKKIPASIVAIIIATFVAHYFYPDVKTIETAFGEIPSGFPKFALPEVTFERLNLLMIPALTIAMLGAIESLLSAIVADGMIESRHDSNQELMGQGIANIVTPFFGGISATGAIARTAANVRSGARTPISGIIHSLTLVVIVFAAAPFAKFIPLAALSAVLFVVAFRMGEWENFIELARSTKSDFGVLVLTFLLTVIFDLTVAVGVGLTLAGILFVRRMEEITHVQLVTEESEMDLGVDSIGNKNVPKGVLVYRLEGPFFFAAAEKLEAALARYSDVPRIVIFRMRTVPAMDATGLHALEVVLDKFHRKGTKLLLSGVQPQPMKLLFNSGFVDKIGLDNICGNIDEALKRAAHILETK